MKEGLFVYLNDLTVYYQLTDDKDILFLLENVHQLTNSAIQHDFIAKFLQVAEKYDLHDNLMQSLLTHLLAMHENAFSLSLEREAEINDTLKALVLRDLTYFYDLFHSSFDELEGLNREIFFHFSHSKPIINKEIYEVFSELQSHLSQSTSVEDFYDILYNHYCKYGVGKYGLNTCFFIFLNLIYLSVFQFSLLFFQSCFNLQEEKYNNDKNRTDYFYSIIAPQNPTLCKC